MSVFDPFGGNGATIVQEPFDLERALELEQRLEPPVATPVDVALKSGALPVHAAAAISYLAGEVEGLKRRVTYLEASGGHLSPADPSVGTDEERLAIGLATGTVVVDLTGQDAAADTQADAPALPIGYSEYKAGAVPGETPVLPVGKRRTPAAEPADTGSTDATPA